MLLPRPRIVHGLTDCQGSLEFLIDLFTNEALELGGIGAELIVVGECLLFVCFDFVLFHPVIKVVAAVNLLGGEGEMVEQLAEIGVGGCFIVGVDFAGHGGEGAGEFAAVMVVVDFGEGEFEIGLVDGLFDEIHGGGFRGRGLGAIKTE